MGVDKEILRILKEEGWLSTYAIHKKSSSSWQTTNTHCYKLLSNGLVEMKRVKVRFQQDKVLWRLKGK